MSNLLTPNQIYRYILENKITKNGGISSLLVILRDSDMDIRVQVIEILEKLMPTEAEIFRILKNSLVSDESELVRFAASKALLKIFPKQCDKPIEWAINNEKSVFFFKKLLTLLETNNSKVSSDFISMVLKRIGDCYHINPVEARFVLDYTFLIYRNFYEHYEEGDENYNRYVKEKYLELSENSWTALLSSSSIENGHIKILSLNGKIHKPGKLPMNDFSYSMREIPGSLTLLLDLELLSISGFCLNQIPNTINKLISLKYLYINRNYIKDYTKPEKLAPQAEKLIFTDNKQLNKAPDFLWEFATRSSSVKKYIKEGVLPSEAPVLALLELLRGEPISNADHVIKEWEIELEEEGEIEHWTYEDIEWSDNMLMVYTLNEKGYVNRITSEHGELPSIGLFPEQLCTLTHLTELTLCVQGIKTIPECIGNLKKLEKLDLSGNEIKELPSSIKKLTKLKRLNLGKDDFFSSFENVLEIINKNKQKKSLKIEEIADLVEAKNIQDQKERELSKEYIFKHNVLRNVKYPPKKILHSKLKENRDFEFIILYMFFYNDYCTWLELKSEPLNISNATLSKYLSILIGNGFIKKETKGIYALTKTGKKKFKNLKRRT